MPDREVLPVGRDPCANLICLAVAGKQAGRVFFYDHEEETLYPLARNFHQFVLGLKPITLDDRGNVGEKEPSLGKLEWKAADNYKQWQLRDGTRFACWIGGEFKAGRKLAVWTTIPSGPIEYRVRQGVRRIVQEWTRMRKQANGGAGLPTYRAFVVLQVGKYAIDFRTADERFSALALTVN